MSAKGDEEVSDVNVGELDVEADTDDEFVDNAGVRILEEYRDAKWGVVDDLDEESEVTSIEEIFCEKNIERTLRYEEAEMFSELPIPKAEQNDVMSQFADVHADDRNQFVPSEYESTVVDFPIPESERVDTCTDCQGNGMLQCGNCNGGGRTQCSRCNGNGVRNDSACGKCGGTGSIVCGRCDGNGRTICGQCEQRGQTFKMDFIRREYTPNESITPEAPNVPDKYVREAEGEFVKTRKIDLGENEIRHEVEEREVPVIRLDYKYGGKEYDLFRIEDELKTSSYPMSRSRRLIPVVVVGLVLVVAALWYFGLI